MWGKVVRLVVVCRLVLGLSFLLRCVVFDGGVYGVCGVGLIGSLRVHVYVFDEEGCVNG